MSLNESLVGADAPAPKPSSTRRLILLGSLLFVGAACTALALLPFKLANESAAYDEVSHAPNADAPVRYLAAAEVAALIPGAIVSGANPLVRAPLRASCASAASIPLLEFYQSRLPATCLLAQITRPAAPLRGTRNSHPAYNPPSSLDLL